MISRFRNYIRKLNGAEMPDSHPAQRQLRIILLGESAAGKSCVLDRWSKDEYREDRIATIGIDFCSRHLEIDGTAFKVQVWDTNAQYRFRTITQAYMPQNQGVMVLYDVNSRSNFDNAQLWIEFANQHANPSAQRLLIGNKADSEAEREVSSEEGRELANRYGMMFIEMSAKEGINIEEAFDMMTRSMIFGRGALGADATIARLSLTAMKNDEIGLGLYPRALERAGRHCSLGAVFSFLRDKPDLLKGF